MLGLRAAAGACAMSAYQYSEYYFGHLVPIWNMLFQGLKGKPQKILEIGLFEGGSTVWMLENFLSNGGEIHCIDHWQGGAEHSAVPMDEVERRFDHNVALALPKTKQAKLEKHKGPSAGVLAKLIADGHAGSFDFVYVDGSHEAADVLADLVAAFQLCKVKGFIVCDDYLWGYEDNLRTSPKLAIDSFINCYNNKLQIPPKTPLYQMYLIKTRE
jgi:predicted O-methyltransferase YrrM